MLLVGILLMAPTLLIAVQAPGYRRGGYNAEFWQRPLDEKLDHVALHTREWWWVSLWELAGLFLMTGGLAGLTYLLVAAGEPVLAFVSFGGYLVALIAWVFGGIAQAATVSRAATDRAESGETPSWIHPFWETGYLAEGAWIIGGNLAYALIGLAILQSELLPAWSGWVSLVLGALIAIGVLITRAGFPQLGGLVPFIVGITVVIESL